MTIDAKLAQLNQLLSDCIQHAKIGFRVCAIDRTEIYAYLPGNKEFIVTICALFKQLQLPIVYYQRQGSYYAQLPDFGKLNAQKLEQASKQLSTRRDLIAFRPESLTHLGHLLVIPPRTSKPLEQEIADQLACFDTYQSLVYAEKNLLPLLAAKHFSGSAIHHICQILVRIQKLAHYGKANHFVAAYSGSQKLMLLHDYLSEVLPQLTVCQNEKADIIKIAANVFQQFMKIAPFPDLNMQLATLLSNAILCAYDYPGFHLTFNNANSALCQLALKHLQETPCYMEKWIGATLAIQQMQASKLEVSTTQKVRIEAAAYLRQRDTQVDVTTYQTMVHRYTLGVLATRVKQLSAKTVLTSTLSSRQSTDIFSALANKRPLPRHTPAELLEQEATTLTH